MKPDSTSAALILSRKIRGIFWLVLGIILMGSAPAKISQTQVIPELLMTPEILINIPQDEKVIIDTRSKLKFLLGHIPGAINFNSWQDFTTKKDGIAGLLIENKAVVSNWFSKAGISPKQSIIIYGDPENPWRTDGRFFWMFERYGFKQVAILEGGLAAWKKSGGTVEKGFQKKRKNTQLNPEDINLTPEVIADKYLIKKVLNDKGFVFIDNRTQKEYLGSTPYGSTRGGHIPNAIHIHWPDFFNKNGTLKSLTDLSLLLNQNGIEPHQEVIVYCTGGVRSAMAYFVFRYLGFKVRNYDGSWWDWSHDHNLPIETSG
ncbi:MAG: rhodanese-like domain-containing protein [Nitrospinota bacterium]